jgi:hypothetical protein
VVRGQHLRQQRDGSGDRVGVGEVAVDQRRAHRPCPVRIERLAPPHLEEPLGVTEKVRLDFRKFHRDITRPGDRPRPLGGQDRRLPLAAAGGG